MGLLWTAQWAPAAPGAGTQQYFSQVVLGGGATTLFAVHNPEMSPIAVSVELYRSGGLFSIQQIQVPPSGTQTLELGSGLQGPEAGWARLISTGEFRATGLVRLGASRVGILPAGVGRKVAVFASVHRGQGIQTALAVANTSAAREAQVQLRRIDARGETADRRQLRLGPLGHLSGFVGGEPFFGGVEEFEGVVEVVSDLEVAVSGFRVQGEDLAPVALIEPERAVIAPGSVTTEQLAYGAVTGIKLADGAVGMSKLAAGSVGASQLAGGAVGTDKLAAGSVTADKVAAGQLVRGVNGLRDEVVIAAGANVTVTPVGNRILIGAPFAASSVYTRSATATPPPGPGGASVSVVAMCDPGDVAISGGFGQATSSFMAASRPVGTAGWEVEHTLFPTYLPHIAYVVCKRN